MSLTPVAIGIEVDPGIKKPFSQGHYFHHRRLPRHQRRKEEHPVFVIDSLHVVTPRIGRGPAVRLGIDARPEMETVHYCVARTAAVFQRRIARIGRIAPVEFLSRSAAGLSIAEHHRERPLPGLNRHRIGSRTARSGLYPARLKLLAQRVRSCRHVCESEVTGRIRLRLPVTGILPAVSICIEPESPAGQPLLPNVIDSVCIKVVPLVAVDSPWETPAASGPSVTERDRGGCLSGLDGDRVDTAAARMGLHPAALHLLVDRVSAR